MVLATQHLDHAYVALDGVSRDAMFVLKITMALRVNHVCDDTPPLLAILTKFVDCNATTTCHGHGSCNSTTGACVCSTGWSDATCNTCAQDYYGTSCQTRMRL